MNIIESIVVAMSCLWANKMRSFLTMLGIIIGISSVITIVALGQGMKSQISKEFDKFGANRVSIQMNWRNNPKYADYFVDSDIEAVKRIYNDQIKGISPRITEHGDVKNGRYMAKAYMYGVNEEYEKIESIEMIKGRFLMPSDIKARRGICIIDEELAKELFKRTNVLGDKIIINTNYAKTSLTIVGIYRNPESVFDKIASQIGEEPTTRIYLPITYLQKLTGGNRYYLFEINANNNVNVNGLKDNVIKLIERRKQREGQELFAAYVAQQEKNMLDNIMGGLSGVIGAIAAISLLVGGIGVMNIMLVSVTERTREIGIRKAIGATTKNILFQFLVEAMIIAGTGGIIGTLLGQMVAGIIASFLGIPNSVSIIIIVIAVSFSAVVGIFFGIYPAKKASKLDPIEALRYE